MAPNLILFYSFSFCNFQKNFHFNDWVIQHYITWNRKEIRNALERGLKNNFHSMLICVPFCYSHFNGIKHCMESPIYLSANLNLSINNIHFGIRDGNVSFRKQMKKNNCKRFFKKTIWPRWAEIIIIKSLKKISKEIFHSLVHPWKQYIKITKRKSGK